MSTATITATHKTDPARWVRLTLGLRERAAGQPFLAHEPSYTCSIQPLDDLARSYQPINWESGVVSAAGYAWRRWLGDRQGLLLVELTGGLGGDGIEAIAQATSAALTALLNREIPLPTESAWVTRVHPPLANGQGEGVGVSAAPTGRET